MTTGGEDELARARALVLAHGWNSTAYQILNPGIAHWFSSGSDAVAGYVDCGAVWTIAGAPVAPEPRFAAVVAELESAAAAAGATVCYLGAEARLENLCRARPGYAFVLLGAQPCWEPSSWTAIQNRRASLRGQLARARNKGVTVERWPPERAGHHPDLARCLEQWLATKGLPPLGFMTTPFTLARLDDRQIIVAQREGSVVGFLVASPVPGRRGWLVEQIVRGTGAPNGTAELLLDAAMREMIAGRAEYVTLGLAPLSRRAGEGGPINPWWLRWSMAWLRAHGRRFYNFDGLDAFKAKFDPEWWDPVYAITNTPRFTPRTLYAVGQAFSDNAPIAMMLSAMGRAVREEIRRLIRSPGRGNQVPAGR
ncbi:MAG: phosphatidylglycerol lysyltransferase domain-containing protein [Gemmatimonadales bacterium]